MCSLHEKGNKASPMPLDCPVFAKLDSCGAVEALSMMDGFFSMPSDVRFLVNGVKASTHFVINDSQSFGMLIHGEVSDAPFVASNGRMLKASNSDMSPDVILSTGQMSDAWLDSCSSQGARSHLADRILAHFEVAGG